MTERREQRAAEGLQRVGDRWQTTGKADAAVALEPLAGELAAQLFAGGLIGAALLAASILPLSTAYAVCDIAGRPAALDDSLGQARLFYGTFAFVTLTGVILVLLPGVSLVPVLVLPGRSSVSSAYR